jgi:hypothetical protein
MLRQVGLATGVAVLIAVLGTPRSPAQTLTAYERASWVIAAVSLAGGIIGLVLLATRRRPILAPAEAASAVAAAEAS